MQRDPAYIGFPPLANRERIVEALTGDPPDLRWRVVRELFQIGEAGDREALIAELQPLLSQTQDFRIRQRLFLALQALHNPLAPTGYRLVYRKGAIKESELAPQPDPGADPDLPPFFPVIDFHIHPKSPDLKFLSDMREAGVTHGVILATDTDPDDVRRPAVRSRLEESFKKAPHSGRISFDSLLRQIAASLHSFSHVTNRDVGDWVADYPGLLTGFGSVNLSREREYVLRRLEEIDRLKLRGLKFLPHSQFFNPSENEHMPTVFEYCRQTGAVILSHSGCGPGPFEILELSQDAHPALWEPWLKKYPDVPVVLAHCGAYSSEVPGIWLFDALQLGRRYANLYADLAAVDWLLDRDIVIQEIRKTIGFNRILFGTDYPLPLASGVSWAYIVRRIQANTFLTDREKRNLLGGNAARLLGLA